MRWRWFFGSLEAMEIYRFGLFELDVEGNELRRSGRRLPLQVQPFALLVLLLRRAGDVVHRDEIRQTLWPPDVHVEFDNSLNAAVSRLRDLLGDAAANPRFIATVPRRGYRFIAPVEVSGAPADQQVPEPSAGAESSRPSKPPWLLGVLGLSAALAVLVWIAMAASRGDPRGEVGRSLSNGEEKATAASPPMRLAVLPITTFGSAADQDHIGDGLTEELIGRLGTLKPQRLAVIARTSVMPYKGEKVGVSEIGSALAVDYLLEGSLRRQDDLVLVTVRLIRVVDQTQLWQRQFERRLIDFFSLQRQISEEVAASLALELLDAPTSPTHATTDPQAYELVLKGQYLLAQRTFEGLQQGLAAFEEAVRRDPQYIAAHLGVAQAWILLGVFDAVLPQQAKVQASAAVDEILRLDANHYGGLLGRAYLRFVFERRWQEAEADFLEVLRLAPNFSEAHQAYAEFLLSQGRFDESQAALSRALELDPLSRVLRAEQCWHAFYARRFDAAIARCRQALEMDRDFLHGQDNLKWVLIRAGREAEAIDAFLRLLVLEGESPATVEHFRRVADDGGIQAMLEQTIAYRLERAAVDVESVVPYDMALDAATAGRHDLAIEWLRRSFQRQETDLVFLGVDPRFDGLRQDPRFQALLAEAQIPPGRLAEAGNVAAVAGRTKGASR